MKSHEIKDLIDYIAKSGLEEISIETEEIKMKVKRSKSKELVAAAPASAPAQSAAPASAPQAIPAASPVAAPAAEQAAENSNYVEVKSPMIGTFYRSPDPNSPSFVEIGDTIKKGEPVCIIEAMKLFNEIESEVSGKIVKVLVDNASPVEYDQPLFLVDPA
jgi:acetyl-CoA carboxylase biotin carboxyl carrier protein